MPPRKTPTVVRLYDNFGQYVLILKCECGHVRAAQLRTLAGLCGWDVLLSDVVRRLRCSKWGKRRCTAACDRRRSATVRLDPAEDTVTLENRYFNLSTVQFNDYTRAVEREGPGGKR